MTRSVTADQFNPVSGAMQNFSKEFDQRLIGGGVHGRGRDFDAQFSAERIADLIFGRAGLELNRQKNVAALNAQVTWDVHCCDGELKLIRAVCQDVYISIFNMRMTAFTFDTSTLVASLIWGSVGSGFFIYGKKQQEWVPCFGGAALVGVSYFAADSALWMSLISIGIIAAIFLLRKRF